MSSTIALNSSNTGPDRIGHVVSDILGPAFIAAALTYAAAVSLNPDVASEARESTPPNEYALGSRGSGLLIPDKKGRPVMDGWVGDAYAL